MNLHKAIYEKNFSWLESYLNEVERKMGRGLYYEWIKWLGNKNLNKE